MKARALGFAFAALLIARPLVATAAHAAPTGCPPVATAPSAAQVQAGLQAARDRGFLWRLRKDGRESWLYGTVHVARLEWTYPGPTVSAALRASDTVALELDLLDPEIQRRLAQAMATPGASLPAALKQRLRRQAEAQCLPAQALERLGPELQVATLESLIGRRDGLDPTHGIDAVLSGWARSAAKTVVSLETPESQLAALTMATPTETVEFVDSTLTEIEAGRAAPALRRIAQVWADGDLDRLTRYEAWCECIKTPTDRAALTRLLDARNPGLADAIAALHGRGQRVFAAVGSLHMIGDQGLPSLLARRGFEVEAIAFARR